MGLKSQKFSKPLFVILAFFFALHLIISLAIVFDSGTSQYFERNLLFSYYKGYSVLGPFFTARSVSSSYEIAFAFKGEGGHYWSEWVYPQRDSHNRYLNYYSYHHLKRGEFEKYMTWRSIDPQDNFITGNTDDYLPQYLLKKYPPKQPLDSIGVIILLHYAKEYQITTDTIRVIKYAAPEYNDGQLF